ncbi:MAG TPA: tRNA (adenosine(37)-N6)-threonylcarbamoyltransferase complex ATPase subunit type 1 TsaE [Polyangia bacterium]|nr:tRNA (adenosine(37)-N6)-threonylcarbamoyltransferase complex ATPase subunit type 1 TsaE [Polyangia bacterium]
MTRELYTEGPGATRRLAERLGKKVRPGDVLTLVGDLGVGKTCFVQGLSRGLGVTGSRVASPTFNIVIEHAGRIPLYHIDLYRIADRDELAELGLETYLYGPGLCAVEWMDRFPELAPSERVEVGLSIEGPRRRRLIVRGYGARGEALVRDWLGEEAEQG